MQNPITIPIEVPEDASSRRYSVVIGEALLPRMRELFDFDRYTRIGVVTERNVSEHWLELLTQGTGRDVFNVLAPEGEAAKTVEVAAHIWELLLREGFDRRSLLLNLGGGAIGDLGGFAASCYMRGIDFVQIPTTLLSQVDASVGGKVGINHGGIKNSIGAFNQPRAVIIDLDTLTTLPRRELLAGYAEVLKHGLIRSRKYFEQCRGHAPSTSSLSAMADIVAQSVRIKAEVVTLDEREGGLRKILNFGHTVGHALESLSHDTTTPLLHGEAVSLGMVAEARISVETGMLSEAEFDQLRSALSRAGLPVTTGALDFDRIRARMSRDKKNIGGEVRWTLLRGIGEAVFDQTVPEAIVLRSLECLREES